MQGWGVVVLKQLLIGHKGLHVWIHAEFARQEVEAVTLFLNLFHVCSVLD